MSGDVVLAQATGTWDWAFTGDILPRLARGLLVTVQATLVGTIIAMVLGLFFALGRRSHLRVVSWPVALVVEFIRSTPFVAQLFFGFFVAPGIVGYRPPAFVIGATILGIHYATYASEAYRAGIDSVPKGQWEAAISINLSTADTWRRIVLPQAVPNVIPALGNYVVAMFKDAPILSIIGIVELVGQASAIRASTFRGTEPFILAGVLFLAVSIPAALGVRYLERRYVYERT